MPDARPRTSGVVLVHAVHQDHGRALLAYATRLTGDRGAAEDVVQETLIRARGHPEALANGRGSTRGWLLTVARNIVTDRVRARASRPREVAETPDAPPLERDHADRVATSVTVLAALDELSEDHRSVLDQIYFQGRSLGEAASALGIPPGTVESRSYDALRALRQHLTSRDPAGDEVPA